MLISSTGNKYYFSAGGGAGGGVCVLGGGGGGGQVRHQLVRSSIYIYNYLVLMHQFVAANSRYDL